jgi:hypothetical protein
LLSVKDQTECASAHKRKEVDNDSAQTFNALVGNTNNAAHPEWRQRCQAAFFETNPVKLLERIADARHAVLDRIEDGFTKSQIAGSVVHARQFA